MAHVTPLSSCTGVERPVSWVSVSADAGAPAHARKGALRIIDQRDLPGAFTLVTIYTMEDTIRAIKDMAVRGAPAIGAAGAFGLLLGVHAASETAPDATVADLVARARVCKAQLDEARPTAVNLMWATDRMCSAAQAIADRGCTSVPAFESRLLSAALSLAEEDVRVCARLAAAGAEVIPPKANIIHHCNTGALATVDIGTALGVIYECVKQKKDIHVWIDETRPRLQGSKLTAWELLRGGVHATLMVDGAAGHVMATRKIDAVLVGADRVARNGDVANKIGTYGLATIARAHGVPAYACVPTSTIDLSIASGADIPIEERSPEEVTVIGGVRIAPDGVAVYNPAFDVAPARLWTGIITEEGVCYPPFEISLRAAKERAAARIAKELEEALAKL